MGYDGKSNGVEPVMLSIIIVVRNDLVMLRECMDNINNQDYIDKEVIIVDDGSTDGTKGYEALADVYLRKEREGKRDIVGVADKKNEGAFHFAKGDYFLFLDADIQFADYQQLGRMMDVITKSDIKACSPKLDGFDGGIREWYRRNIDPVICACIFIERNAFERVGGFPLCDHDDYGMHNRLRLYGYNPVLLDEIVFHMRAFSAKFPKDLNHFNPFFLSQPRQVLRQK